MPDGEAITAWKAFADIADSIGAVAILLYLLVLFMRGELLSKKTADKILEESASRSRILVDEVVKGIKDAVKQGINESRIEWAEHMGNMLSRIENIPCVRDARRTYAVSEQGSKKMDVEKQTGASS